MQIPTSFETLRYTFSRPRDPTGYRKQTPKGLGPTVIGAQHKYPRGLLERRVAGPVTEALSSPQPPNRMSGGPCVRPPLRVFAGIKVAANEAAGEGTKEEVAAKAAAGQTGVCPVPCGTTLMLPMSSGRLCEPPLPLCKRRPCPNHTFWALLCAPFLKHGSRGPSPSGIEMRVFAVVWLWFADRKLDFPLWCTVGLPEGEWQAALARTPTPALPYGSCATRSSPFWSLHPDVSCTPL